MRLLFVFVLVVLSAVVGDTSGISGQLQLKVSCFHHPSRKTYRDGHCDILSDCDPHFRFCLTDVDPKISPCRFAEKEFRFKDTIHLGDCARGDFKKNLPQSLKFDVLTASTKLALVLMINEQNKFSGSKLIDELVFHILPGVTTLPNGQSSDKAVMTPLNISSRIFTSGDKPRVELFAIFRCARNRYGPLCSIVCEPSDQYTCLRNGSRQCKSGWLGKDCDQLDHCHLKPCKKWAECRNLKSTFQCKCDGRTGPQCRDGFDPCLNHLCANNGTCVDVNDRPSCECSPGWLGDLCQHRDPCAKPDPCAPNGICKRVTVDGDANIVNSTCECLHGWEGPFCEDEIPTTTTMRSTVKISNQKIVLQSKTSTITIGILSFLLAAIFAAALVFMLRWRQKRKQKRYMHRHIVRGNPVYRITETERLESEYESNYEDPDIVPGFDSAVYADPGAVYSCEDDYTVSSSLPPPTPTCDNRPSNQVRFSANSNISTASNRTGVRFVRQNHV